MYNIHVLFLEESNGFSAIVLNLPGCTSCGDTKEEALENIRHAANLLIEEYKDNIPWIDSQEHGEWIEI